VVINAQYASRAGGSLRHSFYVRLMEGSAGYTRVARFHTTLPWSPLNNEARFQGLIEDMFSNLGKINPPIEIYARVRDEAAH
jgi:hypothetical protein